jgi:hypothetical protein
MPERVEIFNITCPAGTTQANATETDCSFVPGTVRVIEVVIPPGHAFTTGIAIAIAHQQVIPNSGSFWLSDDDAKLRFEVENYGNAGSWQVHTFNLGTNPHSWQLRFHVDELTEPPAPRPAIPEPLVLADIYAAG